MTFTGFGIYAPNAFSPNGDGRNDRFFLQGKTDYPVRLFRIFDRWGNLVFERDNIAANDAGQGWDGRMRGKVLNAGVFVWLAEVQAVDGRMHRVRGEVTLVR